MITVPCFPQLCWSWFVVFAIDAEPTAGLGVAVEWVEIWVLGWALE
jgi:hypothetical protein